MSILDNLGKAVFVVALCAVGLAGSARAETTFTATPDNQIRMQWEQATAADILNALAEKANKKIVVSTELEQQRLASAAIEADNYDNLFAGVLENAVYDIVGDGMNEVISITALNGFPLAQDAVPNNVAAQQNPATGGAARAGMTSSSTSSVPRIPVMPQVPTDMNASKEAQSLDELQRQRAAQQNAVFYYYATGTKPEAK